MPKTIHDVHRAPVSDIADMFLVSRQAVEKWVLRYGCPRNDDDTYSLPAVIDWWKRRYDNRGDGEGDEGLSRKEQKLQKEIELKEVQIQKIKENFIERSFHETVMTSRAGSLRRFLEKSFVNAAVYLVGKDVDAMRTALLDLAGQCMDTYVGKRRPADNV